MNRNALAFVAVAGIVGALVFLNNAQPDRRTPAQIEAAEKRQAEIEEAKALEQQYAQNAADAEAADPDAPKTQLGDDTPLPDVPEVEMTANTKRYLFETTKGIWILDVYPDWAPIGAEQFDKAVNAGVYNGAGIFRVIPGFVIQFGIPGDPELAMEWNERNIEDEPVKAANEPGTITFAKSNAPNSRTTQLFINLGNNRRLDQMGFSPFGKIVHGMDVVQAINAEYGERPRQDLVQTQGSAYLTSMFPRLDFVQRVTLIADTTSSAAGSAETEN